MKHVLLLFVLALTAGSILTGCKSKANKQNTTKQETQQAKALEVDDVLAQADQLNGKTFTTEAICTHICAHGGGKIFLMGSDDTKTIRVEAGEKIGRFKPETVNNLVRVTGKLVEQRIDEDYLSNWEAQVKAQTDEKHGTSGQGCESEQKARGEAASNSVEERIANFRKRIAERQEKEGKNYLSFYFIEGDSYEIVE